MLHARGPWILWLLFLAGFAVLCGFAAFYDRFPADLWLAHRLQDVDATAFVRAMDWAEDLADSPDSTGMRIGNEEHLREVAFVINTFTTGNIVIVLLLSAALLFTAARRWEALLLPASMLATLLNVGLKELVDRPRPAADLVAVSDHPSSPSFPSGHADTAVVLYGLLFYFITLYVRRPVLRLLGQAICMWVIVFAGMERVFVGAHWPSDVLGGYYLGGLTLAALITGHRLIRIRSSGE
jgi:membrane-associated phospholipid phosphatase